MFEHHRTAVKRTGDRQLTRLSSATLKKNECPASAALRGQLGAGLLPRAARSRHSRSERATLASRGSCQFGVTRLLRLVAATRTFHFGSAPLRAELLDCCCMLTTARWDATWGRAGRRCSSTSSYRTPAWASVGRGQGRGRAKACAARGQPRARRAFLSIS